MLWDWLQAPSGAAMQGSGQAWSALTLTHGVSAAAAGLALLAIPLALARFAALGRNLPPFGLVHVAGALALCCGVAHLLSVYALWSPAPIAEGLAELATAVLAVTTAVVLWRAIPRFAALTSPREMQALNRRLQDTIVEQARTAALLRDSEAQVRAVNAELERRVTERTAELSAANARLTKSLAEHAATEDALRQGEARLRLAVEAAQLGVWEMDLTEKLGRLDTRAAAMSGGDLPAETWIPLEGPHFTAWAANIHPDDLPARTAAAQAIRSGTTEMVQMEYRVRREDDWVWLTHWRAVVDRDPATGAPTRAIGVILDTTERAMVEARLREALAHRDLLLREVYHRVKNNLQIVDGLLLLQSRDLDDPAAIQGLADLRSRIYALGLVHAQLMASKNLETFDIAPFLQELTENIVAGGGRAVAVDVRSCPLEVSLDFAVPLGLLLTELITNSLKHAFPDGGGRIQVSLERDASGDAVLTVADDGPGNRSDPAALGGKPGMGASIIAGLAKQLSATLTVRDDGGRTTIVAIPASEFA